MPRGLITGLAEAFPRRRPVRAKQQKTRGIIGIYSNKYKRGRRAGNPLCPVGQRTKLGC